jgi:AbrB family looped-hinge helix DNA binding protein
LINDQFLRLNDLCEEGGIPVWHWHGDVSASHKRKLLKKPSGILQITPESLEALLMHKHGEVPGLFGDLRYVVIDEIHSLLRGDRGGQCMCLIQRLSRMAGVNPRRIGLSATIGDPEEAGRFLAQGSGRGTVIPDIEKCSRLAEIYGISIDSLIKTEQEERLGMIPPAPKGKSIWGSVIMNERGQIVIPKAARDRFGLTGGQRLIVLSDEEGIALVPAEIFETRMKAVLEYASMINGEK